MNKICVCRCCGRTMNKEYLYCPWCGESKLDVDDRESMNAVFDSLIEIQNRKREDKINEMKDKLDALDRELSNLALSVEMHR